MPTPGDHKDIDFGGFATYRIVVQGALSADWSERLAGLAITIYFAPQAPEGHEDNWIQTIPGKSWFIIFRVYGPLEPWLDKTWRPGESSWLRRERMTRRLTKKGACDE